MNWKEFVKPGSILSGLSIFITLLVDSEGAASRLSEMMPWLSAFLPLIAVGGTAFFSVCAVIWTWSWSTGLRKTALAQRRDKANWEVRVVVNDLHIIRNRIEQAGHRFSLNRLGTTDEEHHEALMLMREIGERGLGLLESSNLSAWVQHINWILPRIQRYGLEQAKAERDKMYVD